MKDYAIDGRKLERKFVRFLQKRKSYLTVTGKENQLVSVNKHFLVLQSALNKKPWAISRKKIRQCINYTFFKRSVVRKDLEKFSSFSSSLLAIMFKVFERIVFIKRLKNGLLRLTIKGIRVYMSGLERDPSIRNMVKEEGGKYLLLNYYYIRNNRFWTEILDDFSVIIDSGAFTMFKQSQKAKESNEQALFNVEDIDMISIQEYASFIARYHNHPRILGFFNLDVIGDPLATKANYRRLKDMVPNATIYPVWQFEDTLDSLDKLSKEDHELIGLGGCVPYLSTRTEVVRRKFRNIFSRFFDINFHFLGGANEFLLEFDFFSSDTTAFLNSRKSERQRKVYLEHGERVDAPSDMSVVDIIRQNIKFLVSLEKRYNPVQGSLETIY